MYEVLPGSPPEGSLVTVKVEDPTWKQPGNSQEGKVHAQELHGLRFRSSVTRRLLGPGKPWLSFGNSAING